MGGKAAVRDHVSVCSYVRIAAKAGVTKSITAKGDYAGFPAQPSKDWREQKIVTRMLTKQMRLAKFRTKFEERFDGDGAVNDGDDEEDDYDDGESEE
mmetsp:Transcript_891/g.1888  ORF Transcript_891/g.1888 Transcript_891/m.1888 type:complete len:97 (+) Transcript_891:183-473(+)